MYHPVSQFSLIFLMLKPKFLHLTTFWGKKPHVLFAANVVQSLSCVQLFATQWTLSHQASYLSLSSRVCSNSCPLSWWCYLTILSSTTLFSFYLQYFLVQEQDGRVEEYALISPVRTPRSQLAAEQPSTGECWIPPPKNTLHPRAKEKPQKEVRRGTFAFKIKFQTYCRCSEGANKTLCPQGPRQRISDLHKRLSQTYLWVTECHLWRQRSAVTCCSDRGSGCRRPGSQSMWHKSSWEMSSLAPP